MKLNFTLKFADTWIAENEEIRAEGSSLEELDKNLAEKLRKAGYKGRLDILMKFDYSTIPDWMRQFHPHYFNRRVVLEID
ncbi:MAG: DUF5395 family protein [Archaeoglobus sp.]|uniref:DUF5395 family protein n=1 Tax=Archaeoglobus sp. TaxID=1872626 RepID=UPI001D8997CB|nr:DUF5395 family protein [Archaeoglobus sp.]MBO8180603.1 DUF5395 family protein [Archaeoglobus sp.]